MLKAMPVGVMPKRDCLLGSTPKACAAKKKFGKDGRSTGRCSSDCEKCGFNIKEAKRRKELPLTQSADGLDRKILVTHEK